MNFKFALILALQLLSIPAFADTPSKTGQAATSQNSQSVFVVEPEDLPKQNSGVVIDTPRMPEPEHKKPIREVTAADVWSGPVPLSGGLWVLVASMPVLASLYFAYQLFLFIQARRRRLSARHDGQ